jgi:hypothetical protein
MADTGAATGTVAGMAPTADTKTHDDTDLDADAPVRLESTDAAVDQVEVDPPSWRAVSVLAELSDRDAEAVAQRLAAAWMAPDSAVVPDAAPEDAVAEDTADGDPDGDADGDAGDEVAAALEAERAELAAAEAAEMLAAVHDEAGHIVFIDFLRSFDGTAGVLGAVLDTVQLLRTGDRDLGAAAGLDAKGLDAKADEISDLVLDGDLDAAVSVARGLLVKVRSTLDKGRTSNPIVKLLRRDTSALRYDVSDLLSSMSAKR